MAKDKIKKPFNMILKSYTYGYSITGNGSVTVTVENLGISPISGYTPVAIIGITTGSADVLIRGYYARDTGNVVYLRNISSSAQNNINVAVTMLFAPTEFLDIR